MAHLFKEFDAVSKKEWLAKVEKDLKGKPLASLNWQLNKTFTISPFAKQEDFTTLPPPINKGQADNSWEIGVLLEADDPKSANQAALQALEGGATAIAFSIPRSLQKQEIALLLENIQLEWMSTHFIFEKSTWKRFVSNFLSYLESTKANPAKVQTSFSLRGNVMDTTGEKKVLQALKQSLPTAKFLTVNGQRYYKGKEHTAKELANTLKAGNDLLLQVHQAQLDVSQYVGAIQFSVTLGDSYLLNIAKIRALKLLWPQVLNAWDDSLTATTPIEVHLGLHSQNASEHYNKIKATSQAMAAVIGGVQRLYIYPSDETAEQKGTAFARRIAWNIQHLLQLESYLDRVVDPAAGSYYIEKLTDQLAEAAWEQFQHTV